MTGKTEQTEEIVSIPQGSEMEVLQQEDFLAVSEEKLTLLKEVRRIALKITTAADWVDQNGKPYLMSSGAEKVARLFAVGWGNFRKEKIMTSDEQGSYYIYEYTGDFTFRNDKIEAIGTCSQRDQFFAKVNGKLKPESEIDETNIMKAACTNCRTNGITQILGLRNLTWEDLKVAGIEKEKAAKVTYATGGAGGGLISEGQARRVYALLKQTGKAETDLIAHLKTNYQIEKVKDIKRADYEKICERILTPKGGK